MQPAAETRCTTFPLAPRLIPLRQITALVGRSFFCFVNSTSRCAYRAREKLREMRWGDKILMLLPTSFSKMKRKSQLRGYGTIFSLLTFSYSFQINYKRRRSYYSFALVLRSSLLSSAYERMRALNERRESRDSGDGFHGEQL